MSDFDFNVEIAKGGYVQVSRVLQSLDPAFDNISFILLIPTSLNKTLSSPVFSEQTVWIVWIEQILFSN